MRGAVSRIAFPGGGGEAREGPVSVVALARGGCTGKEVVVEASAAALQDQCWAVARALLCELAGVGLRAAAEYE